MLSNNRELIRDRILSGTQSSKVLWDIFLEKLDELHPNVLVCPHICSPSLHEVCEQ